MGLKTTEEEISEIIAQSLSLDLSSDPSAKKMFIKIRLEDAKKEALAREPDHENIVEILNQVIALDPETPWAHFDRGRSLQNLGRYKDAALDFTQELKLHKDGPGVFRSYFERAWCNIEMNEIRSAVQDFNNYEKSDTSNEIDAKSVTALRLSIDGSVDKLHEEDEANHNMYVIFGTIFTSFFLATSVALLLKQYNDRNRGEDSDHFRDEKEATDFIKGYARGFVDSMSYEELANDLVENFNKLPEGFFQRIIKSSSTEELRVFLDEQQILSAEVKKDLVVNFKELKEIEKDRLLQPHNFNFPKNYLRDFLLKNSDSQNYPNDPARMAEAIRNFEDEASRYFQEICENLLRHEKIKPLLADVEGSLTKTEKDSNAVRPEVILKSSEEIFNSEIPSESPSTAAGEKIDLKPFHSLRK